METSIANPQRMKLCIPSVKGVQVVDLQSLIYIEASSNYSHLFFTDRPRICASKPVHTYATLLEGSNFVRVHKSFVVNLDHVTAYVKGAGSNVLMTDGKAIDVARSKREVLMRRMREYFKY
jgi:two-component system, LytTR family, response regulator